MTRHPEHQYLELLRELLIAPPRPDRTGTGTRAVFGRQMRFDLDDGFPLLTTKRLPFRLIAAELLWFLSGSTNVRDLQAMGCGIWDEWADEAGELGPVYGSQWRSWRHVEVEDYGHAESRQVVTGDGPRGRHTRKNPHRMGAGEYRFDQIQRVLDSLRSDPYGRRHIVSAWNVGDIDAMALPPCHVLFQFQVGADERLNLSLYQRSADVFLGLPFNIASYALLLCMTAHVLGRRPGEFVWMGGDVHLYMNHEAQAAEQRRRRPLTLPTLVTSGDHSDLDHWSLDHLRLYDYAPHPHIAGEVSV